MTDAVATLRRQLQTTPGASVTVDLPAQILTGPDGRALSFAIDRTDAEARPWVVTGT